ncbi:hypothetical protein TNCV_4994401 [Trichonephila clavipes]|nr:hypothetical protein TNCV_4994401 [Trichonephila clavipes]
MQRTENKRKRMNLKPTNVLNLFSTLSSAKAGHGTMPRDLNPVDACSTVAPKTRRHKECGNNQTCIREQPLSSHPSEIAKLLFRRDEEPRPRLPDPIDQPITVMPLSRVKNNSTLVMPNITYYPDVGLSTLLQSGCPKRNAYSWLQSNVPFTITSIFLPEVMFLLRGNIF